MKQILLPILSISLVACSAHKDQTAVSVPSEPPVVIGGKRPSVSPAAVVPMARIYKTDGDYASLVPVSFDQRQKRLISYPAPSDLAGGEPVRLSGGYLLDRRGVSANTAFTRWTYREYSAMESAPTASEIVAAIVPGARVTEIYQMPFAASAPDAAARCDSLIAEGLPGCRLIYSLPVMRADEKKHTD